MTGHEIDKVDGDRQVTVELGEKDSLQAVLEREIPTWEPCGYLGCGKSVSLYEKNSTCRYCKKVYCRAHFDYRVHGCCLKL